ncbi:hypothetical protein PO124_35035 [Bacillus licheniformis]|nr:hypothetical protein [Bacillus licheniformis]
MNWEQEVLKDGMRSLRIFRVFKINSVLDEETAGPGRPFGKGFKNA